MALFERYDIASEIMMLLLAITILLISMISKPKESYSLHMTRQGLLCGIATIVTHGYILWLTAVPEQFTRTKFVIAYCIYAVLYSFILYLIVTYMTLLSYKMRQQFKKVLIRNIIATVFYFGIVSFPLLTNRTYEIAADGTIFLTRWFFAFEICGMISALFCFITGVITYKSISRAVGIGTLLFCPLDIILLIFQVNTNNDFFVSVTYVVPFVIFYCLFHSNTFDVIIGCQNFDSFASVIDKAIANKRKFAVIQVSFPQIKNREITDIKDLIEDISSTKCREIERIKFNTRVYCTNNYVFSLLTYVKDEAEAYSISEKVREILEKPVEYHGDNKAPRFKQSLVFCNPMLNNSSDYFGMFAFLKRKFKEDNENEYIVASEADYKAFENYNAAEKLVRDIRVNNNLDDDRILCFIQPIHSIEKAEFRTGEALMRMKVGDRMYFPDSFIPAAENNNSIHFLTLAMVTKVCAKIRELEDEGFDFDGITVNCSTIELANAEFHQEIIDIVNKYGIKHSHLRLEITESTEDLNYDNVKLNMDNLIAFGINFYLDDYGTGYSNLERISDYPFKTIKFDKSILYSALANTKTDLLVKMQLQYFKNTGYTTVVEGVEDESQYEYCKEIGFDMIQGYYFSKPQPAEKIVDYFKMKEA